MLTLLRRANLSCSLRALRLQRTSAFTRINGMAQRSLKTNSRLYSNINNVQDQQARSNQASENFLKQMPERLVSEGDGLKPTTAANQFDTLELHQRLNLQGYTPQQSEAIITLLLELLDEFFYRDYNLSLIHI